jgi:hypothetical protein
VTVANAAAAPPPTTTPTPTPAPAATKVAVTGQTILDGTTISGTVSWLATVTGPVRRVELLVDGARVATFRSGPPYGGTLDTHQLRNGSHTFAVHVVGTDASEATASVKVTVSNA